MDILQLTSRLTCALLVGLLLPGCMTPTTGDPNQGGLFGWSESKAHQRIDERRYELDSLEAERSTLERQSRQLESRQQTTQRQLY